ncbi:hypothetical protein SLEP1_g14998 [Rubroshorea leprosula]|uniref:Uncharacterized protein n=1 Tax=Rubroshorea leprosula TaxID=152421 RepID=A0AAV5IS16_9ROSI|nr:hypothetical protein SLEP1_g14998 [Rubroshorea leprosula]
MQFLAIAKKVVAIQLSAEIRRQAQNYTSKNGNSCNLNMQISNQRLFPRVKPILTQTC